jgi:phosphoribosyl-AMP cyclohydrolase
MSFDPATLKFNDAGLIPAIAQDASSGEVLMMAWMNAESITQTLASGKVTYWSRSRQEFWVKGATSGNTQQLVAFKIDCDRDCLLIEVTQSGPACHTGRRSCFFTAVREGEEVEISTVMLPEDLPST